MSSAPPSPSSVDQALKLPTEGETREGKKKKKAIVKTPHKGHFSEPNDDSDERGEDPFDDLEIVRALTDKFAMLKVVDDMADLEPWQLVWGSLGTLLKLGHQMLIHIKRAHHLEAKAEKVWEDLRAEVSHLQEKVNEVEHLAEEKMAEIKSLHGALRK
ncbi:hypothetical protein COCNU_scaffold000210G000040 [Cocos nucifera]|nr:hypothetical protein [Cocos nucifera]